MINPKRYVVFYREMPGALLAFTSRDGNMSVVKDGAYKFNGISMPRATVIVQPSRPDTDRHRLKSLERLLDELLANNQIAGYS